jgi:hypothetical protein
LAFNRDKTPSGDGHHRTNDKVIANGEKALHPIDRIGDYAVRLSGLKPVL